MMKPHFCIRKSKQKIVCPYVVGASLFLALIGACGGKGSVILSAAPLPLE